MQRLCLVWRKAVAFGYARRVPVVLKLGLERLRHRPVTRNRSDLPEALAGPCFDHPQRHGPDRSAPNSSGRRPAMKQGSRGAPVQVLS